MKEMTDQNVFLYRSLTNSGKISFPKKSIILQLFDYSCGNTLSSPTKEVVNKPYILKAGALSSFIIVLVQFDILDHFRHQYIVSQYI